VWAHRGACHLRWLHSQDVVLADDIKAELLLGHKHLQTHKQAVHNTMVAAATGVKTTPRQGAQPKDGFAATMSVNADICRPSICVMLPPAVLLLCVTARKPRVAAQQNQSTSVHTTKSKTSLGHAPAPPPPPQLTWLALGAMRTANCLTLSLNVALNSSSCTEGLRLRIVLIRRTADHAHKHTVLVSNQPWCAT